MSKEEIAAMSKDEALLFCEKNRDRFIRTFDSLSDGRRQYDCLYEILDSKTIEPKDLPDYGMYFPNDIENIVKEEFENHLELDGKYHFDKPSVIAAMMAACKRCQDVINTQHP